ncbi:MAG: DUF4139 domain-containing protein [Erysipelotrichaceae bacterium]|nr:DUF4139 domain-containing protein [Erysipelotrichaceae bacterium]
MITTTVKEISVYRNGAYITRLGNVELKPGKQNILIEGLSDSLDPSTLTVSLHKEVSGTDFRVEHYSPEQQNELKKELLTSLEKVQQKEAILNDQIELLKKNTDFTAKENISLKEMGDYIDSLPAKTEALYDAIRELKEKEKELQKKLEEKNKEARAYIVKIDLQTEKEGNYPIKLRYFERNASWNPNYEIRTGEEESASILLKADIYQGTREDFKQVKITLFTGDPSTSAQIPELYPQELGFHQPRLYKNSMMMGTAARGMMASAAREDTVADYEADEMTESATEELHYGSAQANENDTMREYELDGLYDLSNKNPLTLELTSQTIPCEYHIVAIPKSDPFGYLAAKVRIEDINDVLNSSANIFHKDTYLGNIFLSPDPSKETYDISLGKDEGIRLKRTQKKKYRSNVLLKGQTKVEFEYEIEIASRKSKAAQITLKDQIPVSQDKTIQVEVNEISQGTLDEKTGELSWEFVLEAGEKKTFPLSYSVAWPKDKELYL